MLLVGIVPIMVLIVVYHVLMFIVVFIFQVGILVLLYLSTHYPMRSCLSSLSYNCGALCINMASNAAYANWTFGAALLSLLHIIHIVVESLVVVHTVVNFFFILMHLLLI